MMAAMKHAPGSPARTTARRRRLAPWLLLCLIHASCLAREPDWHDYAALLAAHVHAGERGGIALNLVDYAAWASDPHYPAALAALENFPLTQLDGAREQLAFHINAYNLLAIRMVIAHRPLHSIKDVGNLLWPVWKRRAGHLGGEALSLDDIEHKRLRVLGDARLHFAIVCASLSCPDLRAEPYRAMQLDAQLDAQVQSFLANSGKGLQPATDAVHVSRIFAWFAEDFAAQGGVAAFITRYHALPAGAAVKADLDYDWRLNGR